ncbi:MAG TPA: T9SS type A sorting domain-containing protein, partial [Puia sp.]|nr:T9SS type A sorting domain-containing protein [Puia sp.]
IFPNPFVQSIVIDGLSVSKTYLIAIHNAVGETVYQQQVSTSTAVTLNQSALPTGSYWLSIYDVRKNKLIGITPVFRK